MQDAHLRKIRQSDTSLKTHSMKHPSYLAAAFSGVILISGHAKAQNNNSAPAVALTEADKALESKYTSIQAALQAELGKAIPKLDDAKVAAWLQAIQAEQA